MARDRDLQGMSKRDLEREVVKLRELLRKSVRASRHFLYESGVSSETGRSFVRFTWGVEMAQMSPEETRQMAVRLVETAAAAEFDAALVRLLREKFDYDEQAAIGVLVLLRDERSKMGLSAPGFDAIRDEELREAMRRDAEGDPPA